MGWWFGLVQCSATSLYIISSPGFFSLVSFSLMDWIQKSPTSSCFRNLWWLLTLVKCGKLSKLSWLLCTPYVYLLAYLLLSVSWQLVVWCARLGTFYARSVHYSVCLRHCAKIYKQTFIEYFIGVGIAQGFDRSLYPTLESQLFVTMNYVLMYFIVNMYFNVYFYSHSDLVVCGFARWCNGSMPKL